MKLGILAKLITGFVAVLALTAVTGIVGVSGMSQINQLDQQLYSNQLMAVYHAEEVNVDAMNVGRLVRHAVVFADEPETVAAKLQEPDAAMAKLALLMVTTEEKAKMAAANDKLAAYKAGLKPLVDRLRAGDAQGAKRGLDDLGQAANGLVIAADELVTVKTAQAKGATVGNLATFETARNLSIGVILFALILGMGIAIFLARTISGGVRAVARAAEGLAEGDVDQKVDVKSSDEIGEMALSFRKMIEYIKEMAVVAEAMSRGDLTRNVKPRSGKDVLGTAFDQMITSLREMVGTVSSSASSLAAASQQLSAASDQAGAATNQIATTIQQVARGNQDQSGAVQETSASVEQLTRAIDQIAKDAQDQSRSIEKTASSIAQLNGFIAQVGSASKELATAGEQVATAATSGAETVRKSAKGMTAIKTSAGTAAAKVQGLDKFSGQIGSIVEAIDDIAEQTNLLALNAAIEAARAGEHGRGFAVVADEVRKLAERSSRETKQIGDLIAQVQRWTHEAVSAMEQGSREVETGAQLAEEAGETLKNILTAVQVANQQTMQIASAASQMESASQEVVGLMDSVSAIVEESTAATEEVSASTEEMSAQVEEIVAQAQ
ncbi:MAG: methyl-accepting chemotaxis protein, partial [Chloroflexota bacterium]